MGLAAIAHESEINLEARSMQTQIKNSEGGLEPRTRVNAVPKDGGVAANRREAEASEDSENRLRLIAETVPALISYVDKEGRYQFNNLAYEKWFGKSRAEIAGKHMREVLGIKAW